MATCVLLVDDDEDLLSLMMEVIESFCDRAVVCAKSLGELKSLNGEAISCGLAFLDINLGPNEPNGIDVYHWLQAKGFSGRIFFLTAHPPRHPLVGKARAFRDVEVLAKPISVEDVEEILRKNP